MSKSMFVLARALAKRFFTPSRNTPLQRQVARTRLTLEPLEDRTLLSASGSEPFIPSPLMEAGQHAAQNYISSYESTASSVRLLAENVEQQALLAASQVESTVRLMLE